MTALKKCRESLFYFERVAQHGQLSLVSSFCNFPRKRLYWFSCFPGILSHSIPLRITRHLDLSYDILLLFIDGWPFYRRTTVCANRDEGRDMCPCSLWFRSNQRNRNAPGATVLKLRNACFGTQNNVKRVSCFSCLLHQQTHARNRPFSKVRAVAYPPSLDNTL